MMDKNKLNTEVQRASRAKLLLDEPLFVEAFALLKDEYQTAMFQTKHDDDDAPGTLSTTDDDTSGTL